MPKFVVQRTIHYEIEIEAKDEHEAEEIATEEFSMSDWPIQDWGPAVTTKIEE